MMISAGQTHRDCTPAVFVGTRISVAITLRSGCPAALGCRAAERRDDDALEPLIGHGIKHHIGRLADATWVMWVSWIFTPQLHFADVRELLIISWRLRTTAPSSIRDSLLKCRRPRCHRRRDRLAGRRFCSEQLLFVPLQLLPFSGPAFCAGLDSASD